MVKEKKSRHKKKAPKYSIFLYFLLGGIIAGVILVSYFVYSFENRYTNKIYPGVTIDNLSFGGMTPNYVEDYFNSKSQPLRNISITLSYEDKIATISGENLNIAFEKNCLAYRHIRLDALLTSYPIFIKRYRQKQTGLIYQVF